MWWWFRVSVWSKQWGGFLCPFACSLSENGGAICVKLCAERGYQKVQSDLNFISCLKMLRNFWIPQMMRNSVGSWAALSFMCCPINWNFPLKQLARRFSVNNQNRILRLWRTNRHGKFIKNKEHISVFIPRTDNLPSPLSCFPTFPMLFKRTLTTFGRISRNLVLAYDTKFQQNAVIFNSLQ